MHETKAIESDAINCNAASIIVPAEMAASALTVAIPEPVRRLLSSSLSSNSQRAYTADLAHFRASGRIIPCPPHSIAEYLATLADTHAVATIQRRLAAIGKAHRALGHDDPCRTEIVKATLRGIKRIRGVAQREAQALLRDDLFAVLERIGDRPIDLRDKALLLIGFAGAFRRSELVGLNCNDVEHARQGVILHLRRSKTDQTGQGRKIAIPFGRTRWCPVRHLTDWLAHAGIEQGPLFRSIDRHGRIASSRLSGGAVSTIIKKRLSAAGFDPNVYSGHSLRAGLATSAAMAGASTWKIRQQTGHASEVMLNRYIRNGDMFSENAAGTVL
ncbi:site-specific integrase [Pedomonas mirosovicensis]|uniref:site-specific integrase n=1 Tax=Pedomonas mirosovicensis TaxID=2908641 RepID=UPI0021671CE8|nr:site-specific integrase [Pedomonas mirosovicensis]MCH8685873.1 site-specific integrase [Pedomonas mirosovicensis]